LRQQAKFRKSVEPLLKYSNLSIFKMAAVRHFGFVGQSVAEILTKPINTQYEHLRTTAKHPRPVVTVETCDISSYPSLYRIGRSHCIA